MADVTAVAVCILSDDAVVDVDVVQHLHLVAITITSLVVVVVVVIILLITVVRAAVVTHRCVSLLRGPRYDDLLIRLDSTTITCRHACFPTPSHPTSVQQLSIVNVVVAVSAIGVAGSACLWSREPL